MRAYLGCALLMLLLSLAEVAYAQDEAAADNAEGQAQEEAAEEDTAQSDEEILEAIAVEEGGTESEPPPAEDLDEQVFYSGFGISRVSSDFDNLEDAVNLDVILGFRIPTVPWVGIEIDLGQTVIPGENSGGGGGGLTGGSNTNCGGLLQPPCPEAAAPNTSDPDEFQMQALGASLVLKSTGKFYALGRFGYRYVATSIDELNVNRSGTGFGVGAGYRWGKGLSGVQIQYQQLSDDIDAIGITFFARMGRR